MSDVGSTVWSPHVTELLSLRPLPQSSYLSTTNLSTPVIFDIGSMAPYFSETKASMAWLVCGLVIISLSTGRILASAVPSLQQ